MNIKDNLGDAIGEGISGRVYQHKQDAGKVIKEIKKYDVADGEVEDEVELFNRYYGKGTACLVNNDDSYYIVMDKLPGQRLEEIEIFPEEAEESFLNMLQAMESKDIFHADLKPDNLLYCISKNIFYPLDFVNFYKDRLTASDADLTVLNCRYRFRKGLILNFICNNRANVTCIKERPNLGAYIGRGSYGVVYLSADDENFVYKKFIFKDDNLILEKAREEASNFIRFYGIDSAEVQVYKSTVYIKMLRVPGIPLENIPAGGFRSDAIDAYYAMLSALAAAKIMHNDFFEGNVHYDVEDNKFYPIDIGNMYHDYFCGNSLIKNGYNIMQREYHNEILTLVRKRMVTETSKKKADTEPASRNETRVISTPAFGFPL